MEKCQVTAEFIRGEGVSLEMSEAYKANLREFAKQHPGKVRVLFEPYNHEESAKKLFFTIRDRILYAQSGMWSNSEAEELKEHLKLEFGARDSEGTLKSLSEKAREPYTRRELWELNQGAMEMARFIDADVHDLEADHHALGREAADA